MSNKAIENGKEMTCDFLEMKIFKVSSTTQESKESEENQHGDLEQRSQI